MRIIIKNKTKLKVCPFCGGKAEIVQEQTWIHNTFRIRCSRCKITTMRQWEGTGIYTNRGFEKLSKADCINIATLQWNKRKRKKNNKANNTATK